MGMIPCDWAIVRKLVSLKQSSLSCPPLHVKPLNERFVGKNHLHKIIYAPEHFQIVNVFDSKCYLLVTFILSLVNTINLS
jgi:hypothetical protein